jgi:hypothetical protein
MALKTETEMREALIRLLEQIEALREKARERNRAFDSPSEEQLAKKLRGETTNSPFFIALEWDQFTNAGSPSFFLANYVNPDPQIRFCFVTIFFGLAFLNGDISSAIAARDVRWPYVSTEIVFLDPNATGVGEFTLMVPYVTKGTYFGNFVLWGWNPGEPSLTLFDRGTPMYVTLQE